jgi:hypothetical protein
MNTRTIKLILQIAVFGTFVGHGTFAFLVKPQWIVFLTTVGIPLDMVPIVMKTIGVIDWIVALITLIRPVKAVLIYATIWAFAAALMRPLSGGEWLDFVERASNFLAPAALYFVAFGSDRKKDNPK